MIKIEGKNIVIGCEQDDFISFHFISYNSKLRIKWNLRITETNIIINETNTMNMIFVEYR